MPCRQILSLLDGFAVVLLFDRLSLMRIHPCEKSLAGRRERA
ncbi:hypothetical protein X738_31800 [Mesorhizobium sp. LNHC209A00]|nr:hypothetical protein X738_31800 [Mesorhizobium sp. LNHC209A00]